MIEVIGVSSDMQYIIIDIVFMGMRKKLPIKKSLIMKFIKLLEDENMIRRAGHE